MDEIFKYFNAIFGMTEAQYETYKRLMTTPIPEWPEPEHAYFWGESGLFVRLGMSRDFVRESVAEYVVKHYPGGE